MFKFFERHFGLLSIVSVLSGLLLGSSINIASSIYENTVVVSLFLLFTFSLFKIRFSETKKAFKNWGKISFISLGKLFILPLLAFLISFLFPEEYRIGFVLLAAIPAAVATPGLLLLVRGDVHIGLIVTVITSLLAPFTLPLILHYTIGVSVELDAVAMFKLLASLIFGPFILVALLRKVSPMMIDKSYEQVGGIVSLLIFVVIIFAIAPQAAVILSDPVNSLIIFLLILLMSGFFHLYGWFSMPGANLSIKASNIIVMAYSNTGLAIVIALKYFSATTVLMTVLYEFIWAIGLIFMKMAFAKKKS